MIDYTKTLASVAEIAMGVGDESDALERIAAEAAELFSAARVAIFRFGQNNRLEHLASFGIQPAVIRKLEDASSLSLESALSQNSFEPLLIENTSARLPSDVMSNWARAADAATLAVAQIVSDGVLLGMFSVFHKDQHSYVPSDCEALQTLAALCSMVLVRSESQKEMRLTSTKSQLFSVLSHELRTPLTSIMGFTQLIRKRLNAAGNSDKRMMEQLDVLWAQAQRLNRLIDTFVDMSRIERGEFEITRGQVELTTMLRATAQQSVAQASSHHVVNVNGPDAPFWIHGDNKRLEQVFSHIISNAVRYSPQEQPIDVIYRLDAEGTMAIIEISDHGPGIPAARLRDVFDRNYPSGPLKSGGLGVGLYLSKVIIEAHGGQIAVKSAAGQGTTIRIELPA